MIGSWSLRASPSQCKMPDSLPLVEKELDESLKAKSRVCRQDRGERHCTERGEFRGSWIGSFGNPALLSSFTPAVLTAKQILPRQTAGRSFSIEIKDPKRNTSEKDIENTHSKTAGSPPHHHRVKAMI